LSAGPWQHARRVFPKHDLWQTGVRWQSASSPSCHHPFRIESACTPYEPDCVRSFSPGDRFAAVLVFSASEPACIVHLISAAFVLSPRVADPQLP
ncbi:unnamed protein product, partial [Dicrocoelium dendriticum]